MRIDKFAASLRSSMDIEVGPTDRTLRRDGVSSSVFLHRRLHGAGTIAGPMPLGGSSTT
jgi:hypothetical protein